MPALRLCAALLLRLPFKYSTNIYGWLLGFRSSAGVGHIVLNLGKHTGKGSQGLTHNILAVMLLSSFHGSLK